VSIRPYCIVLLVLFACSIKPLHADKTQDLLSRCRPLTHARTSGNSVEMKEDFESGYCWGAFATIDQMLMAYTPATKQPLFNVCLPNDHTRYQMISIFVLYAEKHPERYNEDVPWVAFDAAREAFPCKTP